MRIRSEQRFLAAAGAAAMAATLYALTLAPSVGAGDSGELILAAQSLGVAHPPGYAIWILLARLMAALPFGALALQVNALSLVSSAVAVGLFAWIARGSALRPAGAWVATILFATATIVWSAAVEAEVYGLATAAFLVLVLLARRARSVHGTPRDEALFCFAAGLATIVHQTLLFPGLVLAAWVLLRRPLGAGRLLGSLAWVVAGASAALVIPIRSAAHPSFAWTDVPGLPGLADYLLRRPYGGLAQNAFRLDRAFDQATGIGSIVLASLGWVGGVLAAAGIVWGSRARPALGPVLAAALAIPVALAGVLVFTPDAEHLAQIAPFLAPLLAAVALLAGSGADALTARASRAWRPAATAAVLLAALALVPGRYAASDRSGFRLAERYGREFLEAAPKGATLVLDGDNETFLAAYAARHEGLRPDVQLSHRRGWIFGDPNRLRQMPRSSWTTAAHENERRRIASGELLAYATPPADLVEAGVPFTQRGLLYVAGSAATAGDGWTLPADWPRSTELLQGDPARYDYVTRKLAATWSDAAARWLWSRGRAEEALPWFLDAARVAYDVPGAHLNAATALAATGHPELALESLLRACRMAPYDPEPPARLAVFLAAAGRPGDAARWFERAFRAEPNAALASDAARAWSHAGDAERASAWSRRAAALAPASHDAPAGAGEGGQG